jgi:hypothetical protein
MVMITAQGIADSSFKSRDPFKLHGEIDHSQALLDGGKIGLDKRRRGGRESVRRANSHNVHDSMANQ